MLYETFNSLKEALGDDHFVSRLDDEIVRNLNPKFELREYQKEAIGRFDFYFTEYQKRTYPAQLLFHMATGSGKTLVMAANILYLYKLGYRNFVFFTRLGNIIEKTKDNFLNPLSEKYQFATKIKFGDKEVFVKTVDNFETASQDDINIIFNTTSLLHTRLNNPRENSISYEEFKEKKIVLLADEAHNLNAETKETLSEVEQEEKRSWEGTAGKILALNPQNILLEFTATIGWEGNANIRKKYENKLIFDYSLKQFRLDKFSKEIEVMQADLEPVDRALQAVILSQYRRKIAEKHKLHLKPVLLLKSKTIRESGENYEDFLKKIKNLSIRDIKNIAKLAKGTIFENVFGYFEAEKIGPAELIRELKEDFAKEKIMLLDSQNISEEKQLKLNSLESKSNEIRAIFAVNMLNEGWDVLNLFDIVRLYETRDGRWVGSKYKPGNTTMGEAQLIGRGARYFPFQTEEAQDKYVRKFDEDAANELRVIETLHYHSAHNPKYIEEIKLTLTELGILPEKRIQKELFIKESFKKTEFWKEGVVFINERIKNPRTEISSLKDAEIKSDFKYRLRTGEIKEDIILEEREEKEKAVSEKTKLKKETYNLNDFGWNVVRGALDKFEFYKFNNLKKYFPRVESVKEFIFSPKYLGGVEVEISGPEEILKDLTPLQKLEIALFVAKEVSVKARTNTAEFIGTKLFKASLLKEIFGKNKGKKILNIDGDSERAKEMEEVDLEDKEWYAQNELYGTGEEKNFIKFIDGEIEKLKKKYSDIAILRNEKFFQIFGFDKGQTFEPDFLMILKKKNHKISIYQVFIEPKGDQFKDSKGGFKDSKEGWKENLLVGLEDKADVERDLIMEAENKHFKLMGLPFYNEKLKEEFKKALENKLLTKN